MQFSRVLLLCVNSTYGRAVEVFLSWIFFFFAKMMSSDGETSTPGRDGDSHMNSSIRRHTSVSFGRFENEHLSWDKYSSFSQNKYLEEAERFSTPGSVVKRKAFFEDFFRKKALEQKARLESLEDEYEDFADSSEPQMRASRDFQHSLCFDSSPEGSEHGDVKNIFKSEEGQQTLFMPDATDEKEAVDEIAKSVIDMMAQNNEPVSVSGAIFKPVRDDNIEGFQFRNQEEEKRLSIEEMKCELQYIRNQKEEKSLSIEEMKCDLQHFRNQKEENSMSTEEMKRDLKYFGNQKEENSRSTEEMKRDLQYFGNKKEENSRSTEEMKRDLQYFGNQKEENRRSTEEMKCGLQYFGNKKEENSRSTEEMKHDLPYFGNQKEENRRSTEEMKRDLQQNGKTDESKESIFKEEVKSHLPKPEISNGNIEGTSHLNIDEETPKKPSFTDFHQQNKMSKPKSLASSSSQVAEPINHKRILQRRSVSNSKVRPSKPSVSSERSKAIGGEVKRSKQSVNQSSIKDVLGGNTKLSRSLNLNKPCTAAAGESASTKRESVERRPSKTVTNRPIMNATSRMPTSINQASKAAEVDASSQKQHLTSQKEKMDERPAGGRRGDMHVPSSPRIRRHSNAVKSNNATSLTEEMHVVSSPRVRRHSSAVKSNMTNSIGFGFRSNERAERRKEFDMKREEKMNMKEAEKSKIQEKTQEEKEAEIKQLRKALNFKATPMPHFYNEATLTKSEVRKALQSYGKSAKTGRKSGEVGSGSDSAVEIVDAAASPSESNDNGPIEKHKCISDKHNRATTSGANTPYKRVPREKPFTVPIVKSIKENPSKLDSRTLVNIQKSPKETHGLPFKENPSKLDSRTPAHFQKSPKETLGLARTPKDGTQKGKPPTDAARRIPKCFEKGTQIQSEGILDVTSAVGSCDTESCGTADGDEEVCFIGKNKGRDTLHKTDGFKAKDNSNQHHKSNAKRAHHYGSSNVHSNNESKSKISKASKKDGHVSDESGKQEAGKNTPSKRNVKTGMSCLVSDIAVA